MSVTNGAVRAIGRRLSFKGESVMGHKKFKTVAGYLRSGGDLLLCRPSLPVDKEQCIAEVRAGQRDILNNLFPQIGIGDRIGDAELPCEGVERLLKLGGNEQQVAALETCRRWLKNFIIPLSSTVTVTRIDSGS
jgi:hypothetical protein